MQGELQEIFIGFTKAFDVTRATFISKLKNGKVGGNPPALVIENIGVHYDIN